MSVFVATYRRTCLYCQYTPKDKQARHCVVCGKSLRVWRDSFYGNAVTSGIAGLLSITLLACYWLTTPMGMWSVDLTDSGPPTVLLLFLGAIGVIVSTVFGFFAVANPLKEARTERLQALAKELMTKEDRP